MSAGSQTHVSLLQPPLAMAGSGVRVAINGQTQRHRLNVNIGSHGNAYRAWHGPPGQSIVLLTSARLTGNTTDQLRDLMRGSTASTGSSGTSRHGGYEPELTQAHRPPAQWSENWLAYSAYSGVVLTVPVWNTLPAGVREAI